MSANHPIENSHSQPETLNEWLFYLENLHNKEIDLGLGRISQVAQYLNIDLSFAKVITVAGTNGKGTTCAFLENMLLNEENNVAVYSSPHIEHFNERLRINKIDIDDDALINAFELIEQHRADVSLTYYEYTTLAAFIILMEKQPDFIILEVGLGGRLDATNIIDADIAVVTTVDIDHQAFLGDNRESIGYEKAGIFRKDSIAVVGDRNAPMSVYKHAQLLNTTLFSREENFSVINTTDTWQWQFEGQVLTNLHLPFIPQDNVATALMVLTLLKVKLSVEKVNRIINKTRVAGRTEMFHSHCDVMLDVAHNRQAAAYLAQVLKNSHYENVYAVVGMLADKDITQVLLEIHQQINGWYLGGLPVPRAATAEQIAEKISFNTPSVNCFDNITQAFKLARQKATEKDLIVVFGSFFTVAEIRRLLV